MSDSPLLLDIERRFQSPNRVTFKAAPLPIKKTPSLDEVSAAELARTRFTAQVAIAMPELGWSVGEALFMPLLLTLHVPHHLLTLCWLFSPCLGLFLHPIVGEQVDIHGRRPFVMLLGGLAALGLAMMPLCVQLPQYGALVAIVAYGMTDLSHDLLMTPTRSAMNDVFEAGVSEQRCAVVSGIGKLGGLACAAFLPSEAAFWTVSAFMAASSLAQLVAPREKMCPPPATDVGCFGASRPLHLPSGFTMMWVFQFAGWLSNCTFFFFVTSVWASQQHAIPGTHEYVRAVQAATMLLLGNSVVFIFAGAMLTVIVQRCWDEMGAMIGALLAIVVVLLSFVVGSPASSAATTVFVLPLAYAIVSNTPYSWLERQPGFNEEDRGRLVGRLNASLAAAQAITALASGPLIAVANGQLVAPYVAAAAVNLLVVIVGLGYCFFRRPAKTDLLLVDDDLTPPPREGFAGRMPLTPEASPYKPLQDAVCSDGQVKQGRPMHT